MGSTPGYSQRSGRSDTQTLIRLGAERGSNPEPLSQQQRDLVSEIARGDAGESRVQLWFQGLPEPVHARLRVQGGRIQLEAALPFLEIDSKVGVARAQGDATRLEGRIARVSLVTSADQPVPRLCVDLALPGEISTVTSTAAVSAPASHALRQDITDATSTPPISIAPAPAARGRSFLPWSLAFVLGVAGGAVGSWGWFAQWLQHPFALLQVAQVGSAPAEAPIAAHDDSALLQPEPRAEALAALLAFPEGGGEADPLAFDFPVAPALITPVDASAGPFMLEREPNLAGQGAGEGAPDLEFEADLREPSPVANLAQGLVIKASDGLTEIVVPMQGNAEGLARYELTTPGIALTLPNARALVPLENYAAHRPLVRRVWLRGHETGVQVRIIYPKASIRDEIRFDDRGLHVLLRP